MPQMISVILIPTIFCFAVGIAVLLYNPGRFTNQILSIASVLVAAWLGLVATVIESGASLASTREPMPLFWLRANACLAAFLPWLVWLLKESLIAKEERRRAVIKRSLPWLAFGSILALLSATDSFMVYGVEANTTERGLGYVTYNVLSVCAYVGIVGQSYRQMKMQTGMRRVERQFLVLNLGIAGLLLVVLTSGGNIFHLSALKKISLFVGSYFLTAWAIALHRIYNARQMFWVLAHRLTMVLLSVGLIFWGGESGAELYSNRGALLISIMAWSFAVFWADNRLRSVFGLNTHAATTNVRMKIIDLPRGHPDTEGYFPPGSAAAEVRLAAKRATRIMSEYVREVWLFGSQLEPEFKQVIIGTSWLPCYK